MLLGSAKDVVKAVGLVVVGDLGRSSEADSSVAVPDNSERSIMRSSFLLRVAALACHLLVLGGGLSALVLGMIRSRRRSSG